MIFAGIAIMLLGGALLTYQGFYVTKEETVLNIGPLDVKAQTRERVVPPAPLGWIIVGGGALLLVGGAVSRRA